MRQARLKVVRDHRAEILVHLEAAAPSLRAACDLAEAKDDALEEALLLVSHALHRYRAQTNAK
jgi:hypothetical protein